MGCIPITRAIYFTKRTPTPVTYIMVCGWLTSIIPTHPSRVLTTRLPQHEARLAEIGRMVGACAEGICKAHALDS